MRYPLAAVLILLFVFAGASALVAQPANTEGWRSAIGQVGPQRAYTGDRSSHRDRRTHRRHHVHRPAPNQRKIAEDRGYKRVSDLVNFPKFFPGLGIVFVKPDTLPLGPFLCFDRNDRLVATVYMVPIKDMDDHKAFEAPAFAGRTDHVSIYFNAGHPGVDVPHYHFVIWHVSKKDEARVAK
jgi:hypothetical protein